MIELNGRMNNCPRCSFYRGHMEKLHTFYARWSMEMVRESLKLDRTGLTDDPVTLSNEQECDVVDAREMNPQLDDASLLDQLLASVSTSRFNGETLNDKNMNTLAASCKDGGLVKRDGMSHFQKVGFLPTIPSNSELGGRKRKISNNSRAVTVNLPSFERKKRCGVVDSSLFRQSAPKSFNQLPQNNSDHNDLREPTAVVSMNGDVGESAPRFAKKGNLNLDDYFGISNQDCTYEDTNINTNTNCSSSTGNFQGYSEEKNSSIDDNSLCESGVMEGLLENSCSTLRFPINGDEGKSERNDSEYLSVAQMMPTRLSASETSIHQNADLREIPLDSDQGADSSSAVIRVNDGNIRDNHQCRTNGEPLTDGCKGRELVVEDSSYSSPLPPLYSSSPGFDGAGPHATRQLSDIPISGNIFHKFSNESVDSGKAAVVGQNNSSRHNSDSIPKRASVFSKSFSSDRCVVNDTLFGQDLGGIKSQSSSMSGGSQVHPAFNVDNISSTSKRKIASPCSTNDGGFVDSPSPGTTPIRKWKPERYNYDSFIAACDDGKTICLICKSRFGQRRHAQEHIRLTHWKMEEVACDICGRAFTKRSTLNHHMVAKHGFPGSEKCGMCTKQFASKPMLRRHQVAVHLSRQRTETAAGRSSPGGGFGTTEFNELMLASLGGSNFNFEKLPTDSSSSSTTTYDFLKKFGLGLSADENDLESNNAPGALDENISTACQKTAKMLSHNSCDNGRNLSAVHFSNNFRSDFKNQLGRPLVNHGNFSGESGGCGSLNSNDLDEICGLNNREIESNITNGLMMDQKLAKDSVCAASVAGAVKLEEIDPDFGGGGATSDKDAKLSQGDYECETDPE